MVPNTEVNLAEGRNERSTEDAYIIESESVTNDEEVKDSIECEILMSMKGRLMPMGVREVPIEEDLLDEGSIVENKESHGSCDLGG